MSARSARFAAAKSAMSTQLRAPHNVAASAMNSSAGSSYCAVWPRGSSMPAKTARTASMQVSPEAGDTPENPRPQHWQVVFLMCNSPGQPRRQWPQPLLQRDLQAIRQERNEDVRLDPCIGLMEDWPDREVAL